MNAFGWLQFKRGERGRGFWELRISSAMLECPDATATNENEKRNKARKRMRRGALKALFAAKT